MYLKRHPERSGTSPQTFRRQPKETSRSFRHSLEGMSLPDISRAVFESRMYAEPFWITSVAFHSRKYRASFVETSDPSIRDVTRVNESDDPRSNAVFSLDRFPDR